MHLEKFRLDQTQNSRLPIGHYLLSHAQTVLDASPLL